MRTPRTRAFLLAIGGGALAATAAFLACSSSTTSGSVVDAGVDATRDVAIDLGITVFETSSPDVSVVTVESGTPDTNKPHDAGVDVVVTVIPDAAGEAHAFDSGNLAACSLVNTACDIVSQNCTAGSECVITEGPTGTLGTACEPDQATEHLAKGAACCPSADGTNPCDPGLECNGGNPCAADAGSPGAGLPPGWGGSRCTPRCCPADGGNTGNCGTAGDGGVQGHCDLGISFTNNGPSEYSVCTYPQTCEPFHVHPCITGFGCEIENVAGTSQCVVIYNPNGDGGATAGQSCDFANQCADGLVCIGNTTSACQWLCHLNDAGTPFSAGSLKGTPGYGGCPAATTCTGVTGFPAWLGSCQTN